MNRISKLICFLAAVVIPGVSHANRESGGTPPTELELSVEVLKAALDFNSPVYQILSKKFLAIDSIQAISSTEFMIKTKDCALTTSFSRKCTPNPDAPSPNCVPNIQIVAESGSCR